MNIKEIKSVDKNCIPTDTYTGIFYCADVSNKTTKNGKSYHDILLRDSTGTIKAKVWDLGVEKQTAKTGMYVQISYTLNQYNNDFQLIVSALTEVDASQIDPKDFYESTPYNIDKMYDQVLLLLDKVQNPELRKLAEMYTSDPVFVSKFKSNSAAKSVHHAFYGGLVQHTMFVMRNTYQIACNYKLDVDLVVTAAFLHDIGKLEEISAFPENDYTDVGRTLGHIYLSAKDVEQKCDSIEGFNPLTKLKLVHCILSHHGQKEFGSPITPAFGEAFVVHLADLMDSKLEQCAEFFETKDSGWDQMLETFLWRGDELHEV